MNALITFIIGFGLVLTSLDGHTNETAAAPREKLLTRLYKVDPNTFVRNLKHLVISKSGESTEDVLARFFKKNNVDLKKPAAVLFNQKQGWVLIRTTKADQDRIELLVCKILGTK